MQRYKNPSSQVRVALQKGILKRKPCEVCGSTETEAHHPDYNRPLHVRWLCRPHHRRVHLNLKRLGKTVRRSDNVIVNILIPTSIHCLIKESARLDIRTPGNLVAMLLELAILEWRGMEDWRERYEKARSNHVDSGN